ncbi:hypothetical protein [Amycolatopsis sp. NPDC059657]|uniref:hypothetical protein n=1 Tax=Amycolatopsis sp. NPDC059657 TaxID=3346899 RepID=UPI00366C88D9
MPIRAVHTLTREVRGWRHPLDAEAYFAEHDRDQWIITEEIWRCDGLGQPALLPDGRSTAGPYYDTEDGQPAF